MKIVADRNIPFFEGVFEPYAEVIYKEGQDISGDYNHYETCTETSTEDGAILTEYSNSSNNAIKLLISYNGYSWSFVAQGGNIEDFKSDIVNQILDQK
jgi:hypothetical protein